MATVRATVPEEYAKPQRRVPRGMAVLVHRGKYFLVPQGITLADLEDPLVQANPRIQSAQNLDSLLDRAITTDRGHQVEFAGWMPQFEDFGNCGNHPQFLTSLRTPPKGWAFVQNPPLRALRPEVIWDVDFDRLLGRLDHIFGLATLLEGRSDTVLVTSTYRESAYNIYLSRGEYFAVPHELVRRLEFRGDPRMLDHPGVIRAQSLAEVLAAIKRKRPDHNFGANPGRPVEVFRTYYGLNFRIFQYRGFYLVWPDNWGEFLAWRVYRELSQELEQRLDPKWRLPKPISEWKWKSAMANLALRSLRNGARWQAILNFVSSREPNVNRRFTTPARGVFVTSVPYLIAPVPWAIEIEDSTSLFFPYAHNGRTAQLKMREVPAFPVVQALLEQRRCRAVLTHIRSTADSLHTLFGSRIIDRKIVFCPLGYAPVKPVPQRKIKSPRDPVNVLFSSSWHQNEVGFYVRGGIDLLEAFDRAAERDSRLHLTVRCVIPAPWQDRFRQLQGKYGVQRIRNLSAYLDPEQWRQLLLTSDIFALPAARIHVVSLLEAMAHGLAVLTSDGWAIDEYVTDRETGLIIRGRAGKVSWMDTQTGVLREDYSSMYAPDEAVVAQLASALLELADDPELRLKLIVQAEETVRTQFTVERWNAALGAVFEKL
ncbi:MAG: glycosyltransferase family 4 protein [Acidobacteriia bacterium]|nr:glycosyltransferase family 4 protein [Terriglobia bacterium]